jgi:hypothetical protein
MISADLLQATVNAARLVAAMAIEGHIYSIPAVIAHLQDSTAPCHGEIRWKQGQGLLQ